MPLSPKLAGTDQVQVSGNSAEPVPNGKVAKLAEGKVEPQRPLSASRRWHQGEQRHVAQPTAHATEGVVTSVSVWCGVCHSSITYPKIRVVCGGIMDRHCTREERYPDNRGKCV